MDKEIIIIFIVFALFVVLVAGDTRDKAKKLRRMLDHEAKNRKEDESKS